MGKKEKTVWSGARIKELREGQKRSAQDLAKETKIPESTYLTYEKQTEPPFSRLVAIANALGANPFWLAGVELGGSEGMRGLVDPRHVEPTEATKMLAGYFYFGDRVIHASLLFEAHGPPGRFGGYRNEESGADE